VTRYRGTVWWGPAPQKATPSYRPWLVLSTDDHPFAASECIAVAMTAYTPERFRSNEEE
jgi:hypothetical protein